jgi:hypothetical protein
MNVEAILIFFVILSVVATLAAAAVSFGADTRDEGPAERANYRA